MPEKTRDDAIAGTLTTDAGKLDFELETSRSNAAVARLEPLMRRGWYDGQVFHRMVPGTLVQGGCPNRNGTGSAVAKFTGPLPVAGAYTRGTIALGSSGPRDGNGSQFFICLGDISGLPPDYPVIGRVTSGFETLDAIGAMETSGSEELTPPLRILSLRLH